MFFAQVRSPVKLSTFLQIIALIDSPYNDHHKYHDEHNRADDHNEIENFSLQRGQTGLGSVGQLCDLAKNGGVSCRDHNADATSRDTMGAL